MLFFEALGRQDLFLSIKSKEFHLTLADFVNIFKELNVLNLILPGKNINRINDCDAVNIFVAKLELGIVELKKEMQLPFLNYTLPSRKTKLKLGKLKVEVENRFSKNF